MGRGGSGECGEGVEVVVKCGDRVKGKITKSKSKVWSKFFCSSLLKIVDFSVRKGGSFDPPNPPPPPPQRTGLLLCTHSFDG